MAVAGGTSREGSLRAGVSFLYEDDVIHAVMAHLEAEGWVIDPFALSHQHGDDIVASRGGQRLVLEAKGDGSSKSTTARFGKPFTRNQVKTHVAVAVIRAMRVTSAGLARAGLALPGSEFHRIEIDRIAPSLCKLGKQVFWVAQDRSVELKPQEGRPAGYASAVFLLHRRGFKDTWLVAQRMSMFETDESTQRLRDYAIDFFERRGVRVPKFVTLRGSMTGCSAGTADPSISVRHHGNPLARRWRPAPRSSFASWGCFPT